MPLRHRQEQGQLILDAPGPTAPCPQHRIRSTCSSLRDPRRVPSPLAKHEGVRAFAAFAASGDWPCRSAVPLESEIHGSSRGADGRRPVERRGFHIYPGRIRSSGHARRLPNSLASASGPASRTIAWCSVSRLMIAHLSLEETSLQISLFTIRGLLIIWTYPAMPAPWYRSPARRSGSRSERRRQRALPHARQ